MADPGQSEATDQLRSALIPDGCSSYERAFSRMAYFKACARAKELELVLIEIRDHDPVENALDPQWAARVAKEVFNA